MQENSTLIIQLEDYSSYLDQNYRNFCDGLRKLPPKKLLQNKSYSPTQYWRWTDTEKIWQWITFRLAYFLVKRIGQRIMPDPLACQGLDEAFRKYMDTISRLLLAELDLIIEGWEIIQSTALQVRGYFPFNHPSELFGDACRFRAENEAREIFTDETISSKYLNKMYQELSEESKLFRGNFEEKEVEALASYKDSSDWVYFAIYSIWNYRSCSDGKYSDLVDAWKRFLNAHKKYVAMHRRIHLFGDKHTFLIPFFYTRDGRILVNFDRKMLEAKLTNGYMIFS